jgi:hypothetical protein
MTMGSLISSPIGCLLELRTLEVEDLASTVWLAVRIFLVPRPSFRPFDFAQDRLRPESRLRSRLDTGWSLS